MAPKPHGQGISKEWIKTLIRNETICFVDLLLFLFCEERDVQDTSVRRANGVLFLNRYFREFFLFALPDGVGSGVGLYGLAVLWEMQRIPESIHVFSPLLSICEKLTCELGICHIRIYICQWEEVVSEANLLFNLIVFCFVLFFRWLCLVPVQ